MADIFRTSADNDNSQIWQFAEVGPAQVLIINNGTGTLLTSIKGMDLPLAILSVTDS